MIIHADCIEAMREMDENSIDAIARRTILSVCDGGWPEDYFHHEECPALDFMYEGFPDEENENGRWEPHCKMGVFCACEHHGDKLPTTCPYADKLKKMVEKAKFFGT